MTFVKKATHIFRTSKKGRVKVSFLCRGSAGKYCIGKNENCKYGQKYVDNNMRNGILVEIAHPIEVPENHSFYIDTNENYFLAHNKYKKGDESRPIEVYGLEKVVSDK